MNGSDQSSGSLNRPFATIQKAVDRAGAGDTIYLSGGVYYQSINLSGKAGTKDRPLTITTYPNENVILDGTVKIDGKWITDEGNVYKTTLEHDITQLFVDGKLMTLARYPNALAFSDEVWSRSAVRCRRSRDSVNGHVVDESIGEKSIAEAGFSFIDCVALMNFGAHATTSRLVKNHKVGSREFDYSPKLHKYKTSLSYFFEGGLGNAERAMLDIPQEWAFDETTKTLYLWADDGANPGGREIYGKVRTYAITGDAATKHIVIDGLNFWSSAFSFESSDNVTIRNCNFEYYASSKRALGVLGKSDTAQIVGNEEDFCKDFTVYNCTFKYSDATAFDARFAENLLVENNLFSFIDYACVNNDLTGEASGYQASVSVRFSNMLDLVYRRNTLSVSGNAQGVTSSVFKAPFRGFRPDEYVPESVRAPLFEYNFNTACGLQNTDGSSLYMAHAHALESVIRFNWFIGNGQRDFRWDGNNKPLQGVHGNLYRNVAVGTEVKRRSPSGGDGFRVKGSYHEVYNNIGLGRLGELNVAVSKGGNEQTITKNNAATFLTDDPIPGTASNNYGDIHKGNIKLADMLRDPDNWDFRPKADADFLIDQGVPVICSIRGKSVEVTNGYKGDAPDLGAYEFGDTSYWIPGRQAAQASMPVPKNGAKDVPLDADLIYLIGLLGKRAAIYIGLEPDELSLVGTLNVPMNIVSLNDQYELKKDRSYFWRVDTYLPDGKVIEGNIWNFTTTSEVE